MIVKIVVVVTVNLFKDINKKVTLLVILLNINEINYHRLPLKRLSNIFQPIHFHA